MADAIETCLYILILYDRTYLYSRFKPMTSSEDFKQAIRKGNINEAFVVAMSNAPKLTITTKIVASDAKQHQGGDEFEGDNCLRTHIDLIEGKVENEIGEKLMGDRHSEIQQFHIRQVTQGHQTIQQNLISLQKMFQLMSAFQQQTEHLSWVDIAADVSRKSLSPQPQTERVSSKTPSPLSAEKTINRTQIAASDVETHNPEPQLPALEEEDGVVDDLLSLADIDDENSTADFQAEADGDWGEWLEDEPEAKPEVFDLKSLNIKQNQKWQKWDVANPEKE